ncbi:hypothetical protein MBLNU457_7100t1 [Dothideomycetes sp. NU457]
MSGDAAPAEDEVMKDASAEDAEHTTSDRKRKQSKPVILTHFTIRNPPWTYLHLSLLTPTTLRTANEPPATNNSSLDAITVQMHLHSALRQFLGLHGTAIPFDVLKIDGHDTWVRLPREDASAVVAALGGWVGKNGEGWRIKSRDAWGPREDDGRDLFG